MGNASLNIIFAGTPDFAVPTLRALAAGQHQVLSVFTQPDRPAGRGQKIQTSPVKQAAIEFGLPVYQPGTLKEAGQVETIGAQHPDLMVVVAYGLILPKAVLDIPVYGCLNVHASLLPRWRGAAPIHRAILAGDRQTGVTIMQMDEGLDTGAMLKKVITEIGPEDTGLSLHDRLAGMGAQALVEVVDAIAGGEPPIPQVQDEAQANYAQKLSKDEAVIDWQQDADAIDRMIRAFNPWPVAYTFYNAQPLRVWRARARPGEDKPGTNVEAGTILSLDNQEIHVATGDGALVLQEVQPAGKRRMPASDFINARRSILHPGTRLGK